MQRIAVTALVACALLTGSSVGATTIDFEDLLVEDGCCVFVSTFGQYRGLIWDNFIISRVPDTGGVTRSGASIGLVSGRKLIFNNDGAPAGFSSDTPFTFVSAWLTAVWNDGLNITIQGFNRGSLVAETTVVVSATQRTLVTLNWSGLTAVRFTSFGGTPYPPYAPLGGPGHHFALDDLNISGSASIADLSITSLENPPASLVRGTTFDVTDTVTNLSLSNAGPTETRYYLSLNGVDRNHLLGSHPIGIVLPGALTGSRTTVTVPPTVAPGEYYLLACADATFALTELNEQNNCRASTSRTFVLAHTPVIVIPGIIGTRLDEYSGASHAELWLNSFQATADPFDKFLNRLKLDEEGKTINDVRPAIFTGLGAANTGICPTGLFCKFDAVLNALGNDGYQSNVDLFVFPYDWRLDNTKSARKLETYVNSVLEKTHSDSVDLVVHSMGGLVARRYMSLGGSQRVNKIIYMGTPHRGSVKSFMSLTFDDSLVTKFLGFPANLLINSSTMATLSSTFPSVYQLLPDSPFIESRTRRGEMLSLQDSYLDLGLLRSTRWVGTANQFRADLAFGLPARREFNIVGSGKATADGLVLRGDPKDGPRNWCATTGNGDGTVIITSAAARDAEATIYLNGVTHEDIPNSQLGADVVLRILRLQPNGTLSSLPLGVAFSPFLAGRTRVWCTGSPVHISVKDQSGNVTGLTGEGAVRESIPGSSFFVAEHNESGFLPANQPHTFSVTGTATGVFDLIVEEQFDDGTVIETIQFVDVPIASGWTGKVTIGFGAPTLELDSNSDGNPDFFVRPGPNTEPGTSLDILEAIVRAAGLDHGVANSLVAKLRAASDSVRRNNTTAAANQLNAFTNELRAQSGKKIPSQTALGLQEIAAAILLTLR
ncbi:MAG: lipase/acyltransferase domain-containing protein [Bryobacteraceae bacterium]